MPVSQELMSAILAMHSYNRDYHAGYTIDATKLGSYSALNSRQLVGDAQYNSWADAGFYAAAYRNEVGETVIGACALGGGTPDARFAHAAQKSELLEPIVGEFVIGPI